MEVGMYLSDLRNKVSRAIAETCLDDSCRVAIDRIVNLVVDQVGSEDDLVSMAKGCRNLDDSSHLSDSPSFGEVARAFVVYELMESAKAQVLELGGVVIGKYLTSSYVNTHGEVLELGGVVIGKDLTSSYVNTHGEVVGVTRGGWDEIRRFHPPVWENKFDEG